MIITPVSLHKIYKNINARDERDSFSFWLHQVSDNINKKTNSDFGALQVYEF